MSTSRGSLKAIAPVPTATDFIDVALSATQRKTPTQIHSGFKISRIRSFYMRKVKFAQDVFHERLDRILNEFPLLDNLHPFLSALLNVLYDKNHYKLALGQLNTARHLIDSVGKDYARLLKFGDSLYRCKQLKKAALGRMATIIKRQKDPLAYLEQVRQHMSRLPAIDPTTRTLLVCGYPNVGKSSFMNKVTRADVDVQPYAFTTKSLFVGHMDYNYLRWQVIDTPGILDHPLDEMNTIEMQSITALAHLRSCVLYFMDLSEQCGYSVEAQCKLFDSIKPLFANKPTFIVVNKIDVTRPEDLDPKNKAFLDGVLDGSEVQLLQLSCVSEEGVMDVRNAACEALLAARVDMKEKTKRADSVLNRLRVATPFARDDVQRTPFIPDAVLSKKKYDAADPERRLLEKDIEAENGGAGVFSADLKKHYLLKDDDWKYDVQPELWEGKNIADFVDPEILARLDELEEEEDRLEKEGFYEDEDEELDNSENDAIRETASAIREKRIRLKAGSQTKKAKAKNQTPLPRISGAVHRSVGGMIEDMQKAGYDTTTLESRIATVKEKAAAAGQKRKAQEMEVDSDDDEEAWENEGDSTAMDIDEDGPRISGAKRQKDNRGGVFVHGRGLARNFKATNVRDEAQAKQAMKMLRFAQREPNRRARIGEADRHIHSKMPKHLFAGKRSNGTNQRR